MKCPGQNTMYWKPDSIYEVKCSKCGNEIEFFKDDTTRKCRKCDFRLVNPKLDFACASYCQHSRECLGTLPEDFSSENKATLKNRLIRKMKKYFGSDLIESEYLTNFIKLSENICKIQSNCNLFVVLCISYLYSMDFKQKYKVGSNNGFYSYTRKQLVQRIFNELNVYEKTTDEIYNFFLQRDHKKSNNVNYKAVSDALKILDIKEKKDFSGLDKGDFLTLGGYEVAKSFLAL